MEYGHPLAGGPGPIGAGLCPIHPSAWNRNSANFAFWDSRKFAVSKLGGVCSA